MLKRIGISVVLLVLVGLASHAHADTPVGSSNRLGVGFGGGLWAIDPATGETVWKRGTTGMGRVIDASKMGRR